MKPTKVEPTFPSQPAALAGAPVGTLALPKIPSDSEDDDDEGCDGFDIDENFKLDDAPTSELSALVGTSPPSSSAASSLLPCSLSSSSSSPESQADQVTDDSSPSSMRSLLTHRVTFKPLAEIKENLCSDSAENGASPSLNPGPVSSQERRRLNFDSVLTSSAANSRRGMIGNGSGANAFRRCMSMVESGSSPASPSSSFLKSAVLDFTSPVTSRVPGSSSLGGPGSSLGNSALQAGHCGGFKRPMAPLALITDQPQADGSPSRPPKAKRHKRSLNEGRRTCSSPAIAEKNKEGLSRKDSGGGQRPSLSRSKSMMDPAASAAVIANADQFMEACSKLADEQSNLTADTRSQLALPTVKGASKNHDLKNIDCHTMANVLEGRYKTKLSKVRIIDARYCYEFDGGHIRGAENFGAWDEEAFLREFFPPSLTAKPFKLAAAAAPTSCANTSPSKITKDQDPPSKAEAQEEEKREILIFHCEFSSARGPALMRKLRSMDRQLNKLTYPALHYPECYLLHDGYKVFYENYPELCHPRAYVQMADKNFSQEERKFHRKSKTWAAGGGGAATVSRTGASSRLLKL